jgi:hypothetical protein
MKKAKCIQQWIDLNFPYGNAKIAVNLLLSKGKGSKNGRLILAYAMLHPFSRRLQILKKNIEIGKQQLGYSSRILELLKDTKEILTELELAIALFYKKEYRINPIKQLVEMAEDARILKSCVEAEYQYHQENYGG